jgi:hypothetical protein
MIGSAGWLPALFDEPLMREIPYLDKLIDELAKGRPMEKVLRRGA